MNRIFFVHRYAQKAWWGRLLLVIIVIITIITPLFVSYILYNEGNQSIIITSYVPTEKADEYYAKIEQIKLDIINDREPFDINKWSLIVDKVRKDHKVQQINKLNYQFLVLNIIITVIIFIFLYYGVYKMILYIVYGNDISGNEENLLMSQTDQTDKKHSRYVPDIIFYIVIGMLLLAILHQNYVYYELLRIIITIFSFYVAYRFARSNHFLLLLFIGIGVLFNPIFPFTFIKSTWIIVDLIVAILFAFALKQLNR